MNGTVDVRRVWFSSSPNKDDNDNNEDTTELENADNATTTTSTTANPSPSPFDTDPDTATGVNRTIVMNPEGYSRLILPGNYAMKTNPRTGVQRKIFAERVLGFFWMIKDLDVSGEKPILGNESCIEPQVAEMFPSLGGDEDGGGGLPVTLDDEVAPLPEYVFRNNRARDATAQCTLVALSYKDFGYKMLPSWIGPFQKELCGAADSRRKDRVEVIKLSIQEGTVLRLLKSVIKTGFKKEIPDHDHERTLLYFGNDQKFKDSLRVHNTLTGYVFLLDGIGRVRWAGSGKATDHELRTLIEAAKELTPVSSSADTAGAGGDFGRRGKGSRGGLSAQRQHRRRQ